MTRLSPQQEKLLKFKSMGLSNSELAEKFGIKENTVKVHFQAIFSRLDLAFKCTDNREVRKARTSQALVLYLSLKDGNALTD